MPHDQDQPAFPELSQGSLQTPGPPRRFPDIAGYDILKELPRGAQASVYLAVHLATKGKVALKVLHPDVPHSARAKRYFEQEVELAARLHHPNIVSIRDSGVTRGLYYFAMEYIRGEPLNHYLKTFELSIQDKLVLFGKICDAVAHAHQHGVIHRDLKPSNILVDERAEPHVLDFGLAKSTDALNLTHQDRHLATLTGEIRGTLAYMAPEQAEGHPERIDVRTDVYTLGVILYRMLTDAFPYDVSGSALHTLQVIQSADPVRPKALLKRLDADIEAIVLKCLEKAPERRYQSAAELRDEIKRWRDGLPIQAKSVSSLYLLNRIIKRHCYVAAILGLVTVIVLGYSVFAWFSLQTSLTYKRQAQAMETSLNELNRQHTTLAQQATFLQFLDAWHSGIGDSGRLLAFTGGTPEGIAGRFLYDQSPLDRKLDPFDTALADHPCFRWLVLGEYYVHERMTDRAVHAFEACLKQPAPDKANLYTWRAQYRLHQLRALGQADTGTEGHGP